MKKLSVIKLCILELVLMGMSAVTAAMLPGKSSNTRVEGVNDGTLRPESTDKITCKTRSGAQSCNKSGLQMQTTNTSVPSNASSVRDDQTTQNQTSNSAAGFYSSVEIDLV